MNFKQLTLSLLFCTACLFLIPQAKATHIIGGELTYSCLGNNQYEISLTVYRDCVNGQAAYDDPAYIGIFDINNNLLNTIRIPLRDTIKLNPVLYDSCLVIPPNVCVSTTTYRDTIELLPNSGGYVLAYQRCCRNKTILNIIDPLDTGATFSITITEAALQSCNTSAKFKTWPPLYICVDKPFIFDQSAIDIDGDSVYYRLCTPFDGATPLDPQPMPSNPPPFDTIQWKSPYGLRNILGGIPLKINPLNGQLTATPDTRGQFVVGICLEEYRKGTLISTTRRDFQFNVGLCGKSVSAIFAPKLVCDNYSILFENESLNSSRYEWDFGVPNINTDISNEFSPTYEYKDTGTYMVRLITQPNSSCADTAFHQVTIRASGVVPNFIWETVSCNDSLLLKITNKSKINISTVSVLKYQWTVVHNTSKDTLLFSEENPTITLKKDGIWTIHLDVYTSTGCVKSVSRDIFADLVTLNLPDTIKACLGQKVQLNPNGDASLIYNWLPTNEFINPTLPQQEVIVADTAKFYTAIINNGICTKTEPIWVIKKDDLIDLKAIATPDTIPYGKTSQLTATSYPTSFTYSWSPATTLSNTTISNPIATPTVTTTYTVKVKSPTTQCEGVAQARIVVIIPECGEPNIFLPNAFTPNDDGQNDFLTVRATIATELKLFIYNRWGEKVFETTDLQGKWDGFYNGVACAPDVYAFYLEVTCINGAKYIKKGNLNLIR